MTVIVGGLVVAASACAAKDPSHKWGNPGGLGTIVLREGPDGSGCKKQYVTRALNVSKSRGPKALTWLLVNACSAAPKGCEANAKLELEFAKWEYTKRLLDAGEEPKPKSVQRDVTPFEKACTLKNETPSGRNVDVTCKLRDDVATGSYAFQAVFTCNGKVIDNWDPVIIIEP